MTPKVKWGLVILGIVLVLGIFAYFSRASIMSHYQKFVDDTIATRTEQIKTEYDEKAKAYQEQIYSKQIEINKKDTLLKVKEQKVKESETKINALQLDKVRLEKLLASVLLPVNVEETKKRLQDMGYVICK